jgi:hypothetical protein
MESPFAPYSEGRPSIEAVGAAQEASATSEPTVVFSYADADAVHQARLQSMQMNVQRRLRELAARQQEQEAFSFACDEDTMNSLATGADQTLFSDLVVPPELGKKGAQLETSRVIVHGHTSEYQLARVSVWQSNASELCHAPGNRDSRTSPACHMCSLHLRRRSTSQLWT